MTDKNSGQQPGLWQRLKAKHWDYEMTPAESTDAYFLMPSFYAPPLRRCAEWASKLWKDHPLGVIQTVAGVAAALVAVIALFRR